MAASDKAIVLSLILVVGLVIAEVAYVNMHSYAPSPKPKKHEPLIIPPIIREDWLFGWLYRKSHIVNPAYKAASESLIDSYSESHYNVDAYIESNHPCATSHRSSLGQTFTSTVSYVLTRAVFYLRTQGNPNGVLKAALYEINASYYPTGSPLVVSDSVSLSSIGSSYSLVEFDFSTEYTMSAKDYAIVVFPSENTNFNDHLVYLDVGCETSMSDEGVYVEFIGYWNTNEVDIDTLFYVYGLRVTPAGTGYQKSVKVNYASGTDAENNVYLSQKCRTDFGDVRFTDDDSITLLDYWIESKVDSDYAIFWVEVADDLSTVAATIYVYYGKADATYPFGADQTQMDATFPFADHFYGTTLNLAKWVGDTTYATVADSIMTLIGEVDGEWKSIRGLVEKLPPCAVRQRSQFLGEAVDYNGGVIGLRDPTTIDGVQIEYFYGSFVENQIRTFKAGAIWSVDSNPDTVMNVYEIKWTTSKASFFKNEVEMTGSPNTDTDTIPIVNLPIKFEACGTAAYGVKSDWCFIRKYVDPEPIDGAWGSEETY